MSDNPFYRNNLAFIFFLTRTPPSSRVDLHHRSPTESSRKARSLQRNQTYLLPRKMAACPALLSAAALPQPCGRPAKAVRPPAALLGPSRAADLPLLTPNRAAAAALTGGTTTPASSHRWGHLERLSPLRSMPLFAPPTRIAATPRPFHQIDSVLRGTWSSVFNQRQSPVLEGLNGKTQLY
jgi:hypothetical protein